ncbi:MAG: efflux RND transporter periplasmic adaptor subunit [Burkholderiales bacterium]|nr:efflux RND transporter periplasmic adaptor subunit [Burkholderiales bacterium]MDE2431987.1 efflux RND transporter periplasmic adaptor subunit [Burkholderiales bacterium]
MLTIGLLLGGVLPSAVAAEPEPSVLVQTQLPQQRTLAQRVMAYGTAQAPQGAAKSINSARPMMVERLLVAVGQQVAKGAVLAELVADPQSVAAYRQAQSALALARGEVERTQHLLAVQLATQSQLATAQKNLADAQAALDAQRALGGGATRETLQAPFDAVVTAISAVPGDRIAAGASLLQVSRKQGLQMVVGVEPADAHMVHTGDATRVTLLDGSATSVEGVVSEVRAGVYTPAGLVDLVIRTAGPVNWPIGARVAADIGVRKLSSWAVPRNAVLFDAKGAYLFQVHAGRARRVEVQPGIEVDGWVGINAKLAANEPVVVLGNYELADNMLVRVSKP